MDDRVVSDLGRSLASLVACFAQGRIAMEMRYGISLQMGM